MNADERRWFDGMKATSTRRAALVVSTGAPIRSEHLRSSAFICGSHDRQRSAKHKGKAQWT
jgi:hypothetical protein